MLSDFNTRYQDEKFKKRLLITKVIDPRNKELLADLNTRELVIDKISSIVQSNDSNTQAEIVPCTQEQEIQVLSKFPPTPTGSTSTKSSCSTSKSNTPEINKTMSKSSQLLHSLFKCNDTEPECAASSQVRLPEQIATEVTVYFNPFLHAATI